MLVATCGSKRQEAANAIFRRTSVGVKYVKTISGVGNQNSYVIFRFTTFDHGGLQLNMKLGFLGVKGSTEYLDPRFMKEKMLERKEGRRPNCLFVEEL